MLSANKNKKLTLQLIIIALLMLVSMIVYEYLKQVVFPDITIWHSHFVTIFFSTFCAVIAAFFVIKKYIGLNDKLAEKNTEYEHLQKDLRKNVKELKKSLAEVKTLSGLLPICASCKKVRDDKGYWNKIESYIKKHSEIIFSHGICPDCARKLYPKYFKEEKKSGKKKKVK